jgi:quercetin dioxygenase-like cupin family protein
MNNIFLIGLIFCFAPACHQNNKYAQREIVHGDSHVVKKGMKSDLSIDALSASPANFTLLLDNQYVRVLEYTLEPGKKDEWHTHPAKSSYVVSGGQLKVHLEDGEIIMADEKTGSSSWMNAVGKHYVENVGKSPVKIILTEIKSLERDTVE